jgi:hypothetical protein
MDKQTTPITIVAFMNIPSFTSPSAISRGGGCAYLRMTDESSVRIVAEAVHVLIRAQTVSFRAGELACHEHLWQPTQLLSAREQILFLPPAGRRVRWSSHAYKGGLHLKALEEYRKEHPDVRLFTPDWRSLCTGTGLADGIKQSYARHWRIGSLRANGWSTSTRYCSEVVCRSARTDSLRRS